MSSPVAVDGATGKLTSFHQRYSCVTYCTRFNGSPASQRNGDIEIFEALMGVFVQRHSFYYFVFAVFVVKHNGVTQIKTMGKWHWTIATTCFCHYLGINGKRPPTCIVKHTTLLSKAVQFCGGCLRNCS